MCSVIKEESIAVILEHSLCQRETYYLSLKKKKKKKFIKKKKPSLSPSYTSIIQRNLNDLRQSLVTKLIVG